MHVGGQELWIITLAVIGLILLGVAAGFVAIIYLICKARKPRPPSQG